MKSRSLSRGKFSSVTALLNAVNDHMTGADIVRADLQNAELAQQTARIRVASMRERFTAIREMSRTLNERLSESNRKRAG